MMTRRDYVETARIIAAATVYTTRLPPTLERDQVINAFAAYFAADNPKFHEAAFRRDCEPTPEEIE